MNKQLKLALKGVAIIIIGYVGYFVAFHMVYDHNITFFGTSLTFGCLQTQQKKI